MHHSLLVVIREASDVVEAVGKIDDLLEKYDENLDVPERVSFLTDQQVSRAVEALKDSADGEAGPLSNVAHGDLDAFNEWRRKCVGEYYGSGAEGGIYEPQTGKFGYLTSYNEDGKWDWYQLGGRWHGFWQVKPEVTVGGETAPHWKTPIGDRVEGSAGLPTAATTHGAILGLSGTGGDDPNENFEGRADIARKRDIDLDAMRTLAAQAADLVYDKYEEVTKGLTPGPSIKELCRRHLAAAGYPNLTFMNSWEDISLAPIYREANEKARQEYQTQEWIQALNKANMNGLFTDPHEYYLGGREAFIERARQGVVSTAALLLDDRWIEQGWGDSEVSHADWLAQVNLIVNNLPDDAFLAIVDYHS